MIMTKINNVCPKCGKSVSANSKFCNACGEKILENTSSAVDMLNKSTKIINTVTSTVSKVESTVNSAAKISSAADQISQIIVRPPAEWQVVVGDMIPVAGQKIVDAAVSTASAKIQQKVTAEVTKKVQDVIITAIPSNDDKKVIQEPVVESPSINTTATPVLSLIHI